MQQEFSPGIILCLDPIRSVLVGGARAAAILLGLAPRKISAAQAPPIAAATVTTNRLHDFEEQFEKGAGLARVAASVTASVAASVAA